jgi:hypothetical protein
LSGKGGRHAKRWFSKCFPLSHSSDFNRIPELPFTKATCATDGEDRISSWVLLDREEYEKVGKMNILKAQSRARRLIAEENEQGPGFSKFEVYGIHGLKFIDRVSSTTNSPTALSGMPAEAARKLAS